MRKGMNQGRGIVGGILYISGMKRPIRCVNSISNDCRMRYNPKNGKIKIHPEGDRDF